jgi:hypothetical protein
MICIKARLRAMSFHRRMKELPQAVASGGCGRACVPIMKKSTVFVALLLAALVGGCKDFPGADGRYATHDRGGNNRGGAMRGLPVTPYNPG